MFRFFAVAGIALCALLFQAKADAALLIGSFDFAPGVDVSLDLVTIDTETDLVDIHMSGRVDGWFGIGFGSNAMANTYGIIVHSSGLIEERRLNYSGGVVLDPMLTIVSSNVVGSVRSIHVQRARDLSMSDYFVFPDNPGDVQLIGATGPGTYGYHGGGRGPGTLTLTAVPEPNSAIFCVFVGAIAWKFRRC